MTNGRADAWRACRRAGAMGSGTRLWRNLGGLGRRGHIGRTAPRRSISRFGVVVPGRLKSSF